MAWRRSNLAKFRFSESFTIMEPPQVRLKRESVHSWKLSLGGRIPGFLQGWEHSLLILGVRRPTSTPNHYGAKHKWELQGCLFTLPWILQKGKNIMCQCTKLTGKQPSLALPAGLHGGQAPVQNGWTFSLKILTTCLIFLVLKNFQLYHVPQKAN